MLDGRQWPLMLKQVSFFSAAAVLPNHVIRGLNALLSAGWVGVLGAGGWWRAMCPAPVSTAVGCASTCCDSSVTGRQKFAVLRAVKPAEPSRSLPGL